MLLLQGEIDIMKIHELIKLLKDNGCYILKHGKRHDIWVSPKTEQRIIIPRHGSQEVPKGTEHDIKRKAGI